MLVGIWNNETNVIDVYVTQHVNLSNTSVEFRTRNHQNHPCNRCYAYSEVMFIADSLNIESLAPFVQNNEINIMNKKHSTQSSDPEC